MPTKERILTDVPMEEIDKILYGEESAEKEQTIEKNYEPRQPETQSRLLKQRGIDFTLEKVPYYKRPMIQLGFVLLLGFPVIWLLMSIFNPGSNAQPKKGEENPLEKENEQLKASLTEARQTIDEMTFSRGLKTQEIELIKPLEVESEEPEKEQEPPPKIAKVQQPPRPRPVARPVIYRQPVGTTPTVIQRPIERKVVKEKEPEIDPMEQWLAQAERGYAASSLKVPYRTVAVNKQEPRGYQYSEVVASTKVEKTQSPRENEPLMPPTKIAAVNSVSRVEYQRKELFDDTQLQARLKRGQEILANQNKFLAHSSRISKGELLDDAQLQARLKRGQEILANQNKFVAHSSQKFVARSQPAIDISYNVGVPSETEESITRREISTQQIANTNQRQILDIGSQAKASLADGIAWTGEETRNNRKYVLHLEEGFKNSGGKEVLPKGTRLIARITKFTRAGLFFMEVTNIMPSLEEPIISVPPGTLEIIAKDGEPLRAKLKQKGGNRDLLTNVGAILAPGVERALDTADDLLLDGDNIAIRRNREPLASGLSGVAEGVGDVLGNQLRNSSRSRAVSYFQFKGQKVRVVVNEDFYLR